MTRYEKYKNMAIEEMARRIIDSNVTSDFCKSDCIECEDVEDVGCLPANEIKCCIRWLNKEVEE